MRTVFNTKEKGVLQFLIFREGEDFVAVCLNLNLIEYGKDPNDLKKSIEEAAIAHIEAVKKKNLPDKYLNIPAPEKYWRRAQKFVLMKQGGKQKSSASKYSKSVFFQIIQQPYVGDLSSYQRSG